jgi:hypothetical protein
LDSTGRLIRTIGRAGDGPGEFRLPTRAGVAPDGHVFVFDQYASRVSEFDETLKYIRSFVLAFWLSVRTFLVSERGILISGVLPALNAGDALIYEFSKSDGTLVRSFGRIQPVRSPELARQNGAGPIAEDSENSIWYALPSPYRIELYDQAGLLVFGADRPNRFLTPTEDAWTVATANGRVSFQVKPTSTVARIFQARDGRLVHQISLADGTVVTEEFAFDRASTAPLKL